MNDTTETARRILSTMSAPATRPSFSPRSPKPAFTTLPSNMTAPAIPARSTTSRRGMPPMKEYHSRPTAKFSWLSENPDHPLAEQNSRSGSRNISPGIISKIYSGWENNDGAFGTFVFDVPARTVTLEHNERFTDVNTTSHEF